MSYILEALKKSQQERELGQVPTLEALPLPQSRRPSPTGPWGLVALVMAGLALAVALYAALYRGEPQTAVPRPDAVAVAAKASPSPEAPPPTPRADPAAVAPQQSGSPVNPSASPPAGQAHPANSEPFSPGPLPAPMDAEADPMDTPVSDDWMEMDEQIGPAEPAEPSPEHTTRPAPRPKPARVTLPEPAPPPIPEDLRRDVAAFRDQLERERTGTTPPPRAEKSAQEDPTKLRLPLEVQGRLPAFIMTAHIYDASPERRFVVINSLKYSEGDTTREGLKVEQILADGVVLNFENNRFYQRR